MSDDLGGSYRDWCRAQLGNLSPRHLAAFAASSVERQFGTYMHVSREDSRLKPEIILRAIDCGWRFARGEQIPRRDLELLREQVELLVPNLDADPPKQGSLILDAAAAAAYLLDVCLSGRVEDAAWAGECARNAVDEWVMNSILAVPGGSAPTPVTIKPGQYQELQSRVELHPLMLREMRHQRADLAYLRSHDSLTKDDCDELRRSWTNGPRSNIDLE